MGAYTCIGRIRFECVNIVNICRFSFNYLFIYWKTIFLEELNRKYHRVSFFNFSLDGSNDIVMYIYNFYIF